MMGLRLSGINIIEKIVKCGIAGGENIGEN